VTIEVASVPIVIPTVIVFNPAPRPVPIPGIVPTAFVPRPNPGRPAIRRARPITGVPAIVSPVRKPVPVKPDIVGSRSNRADRHDPGRGRRSDIDSDRDLRIHQRRCTKCKR
jgi:hypothetical protein